MLLEHCPVVPTSAQATSVYDCSSLLSVEIRRCENALFFFSIVLDVPGPLNINFVSICLFFENSYFASHTDLEFEPLLPQLGAGTRGTAPCPALNAPLQSAVDRFTCLSIHPLPIHPLSVCMSVYPSILYLRQSLTKQLWLS